MQIFVSKERHSALLDKNPRFHLFVFVLNGNAHLEKVFYFLDISQFEKEMMTYQISAISYSL